MRLIYDQPTLKNEDMRPFSLWFGGIGDGLIGDSGDMSIHKLDLPYYICISTKTFMLWKMLKATILDLKIYCWYDK